MFLLGSTWGLLWLLLVFCTPHSLHSLSLGTCVHSALYLGCTGGRDIFVDVGGGVCFDPSRRNMKSPVIKRRVPGGRMVEGAKAYCDAWRKYAEPVAAMTGWPIHSFASGHIVLVSPDYKHTQAISLEFIEALFPVIRPKATKCSRCNAPSSSVVSSTPRTPPVSPPPSTAQSTWTFDSKTDSSAPVTSSSPSTTSSNSKASPPSNPPPPLNPPNPNPQS